MGLRLWSKSVKLAMRSRRRFIAFTLMYTVLMVWMTWNFQDFLYGEGTPNVLLLVVSILSTLLLSILYAWIVINYRKNEIATLKCIGYKNSNIRTIIIGELTWVTFVAFMIMAETLIHITAGLTYFYQQQIGTISASNYIDKTTPILNIWPILATLAMFLVSQILGILVMYSKILKLRPIVALRVLK
ncbi:FtsX-like permease family protein [Promethearchaeum syntrophicum]|uniref:FtsX-like permease family protein n=1 Tax=Promethearchaeum syntrophicum TaxID=2594042 RepID=A0A5B9DB66_9ARCH|nr:FtsX-like permease family protein [Candidatus Prometheoarchaeum syntrophicum]QEE16077.1 FtsX-like permease family protein [Candidatus Prometheoarchaeum syntrophicum]